MILNFKNYTITLSYTTKPEIKITPHVTLEDQPSMNAFLASKKAERQAFIESEKIKSAKAVLIPSILATYQKNIDAILSQYPTAEVTGWTTKVFQAERWLAASDSDKQALLSELPMLVSEANSQDFAVITDLATRIKRKSDAYQLFHGSQTGIRYDLTDRLELVKTSEELEAFRIYMESKGY